MWDGIDNISAVVMQYWNMYLGVGKFFMACALKFISR